MSTRPPLQPLMRAALCLGLVPLHMALLGASTCGTSDADADGYTIDQGDCNDNDATVYPGATEKCDGEDNDCNGTIDDGVGPTFYRDQDKDTYGDSTASTVACVSPTGYVTNRWDCNDLNGAVYPGALETANGLDDDCDGKADEGTADSDGDGVTAGQGDCDDHNAAARPTGIEVCDGVDNDCNGLVDDGLPQNWFRDADADGFGSMLITISRTCVQPAGYIAARGDCNDADTTVHPGATDPTGDAKDQDCGGTFGPEPHVGLSASSAASIQAALDAAVAGQTVWVGPNTYHEFNLSFGVKGVKLISTHFAAATIIDAYSQGSAINFAGEDGSAVLDGFTVTHGSSATTCAGICMDQASPTITNCIIRDNVSTANGGGMSLSRANPIISNTTFSSNQAVSGGAIYLSQSSPTLKNLTFTDNATFGSGGGLYLDASSPVLSNCLLQGNVASAKGGDGSKDGGAMDIQKSSSPTLINCAVVGNRGINVGGIRVVAATATLRNSVVAFNPGYNLNTDGSTLTLAYNDIFALSGPNHNVILDATNQTVDPRLQGFSNNDNATDDDLHLATASTLINAGDAAIYDPDLSRSDIGLYGGTGGDSLYYKDIDRDNMYDGWETLHGLNTASNDGGQDADTDGLTNAKEFQNRTDPRRADTDDDGTLDNAEVTAGTSPLDWYSQVGVTGQATARIPADFPSLQAAINRIQLEGSIQVSVGYYNPLRIEGKNARISGVGSADSILRGSATSPVVVGRWTTLTLQGFTVTGGQSTFSNGGGISLLQMGGALADLTVTANAVLYAHGGGISLTSSSPDITACTISSNTATTYGVDGLQTDSGNGGGLYLKNSNPHLTDCTIQGNTLLSYTSTYTFIGSGGGMYLDTSSPIIQGGAFQDNDSGEGDGGGLLANKSTPTLEGVLFKTNKGHYGAAIYLASSNPSLTNCTLSGNVATTYGGGLYVYKSNPTLTNCLIKSNTAGGTNIGSGGGLSADAASAPVITSSIFQGNSAHYGGALYLYGASPVITNSVLSANTAKTTGGGIYVAAGLANPVIVNSILAFNTSYNLYVNKDSVTGTTAITYSDLYISQGTQNTNLLGLDASNKTVEPGFMAYGTDGAPTDFHLTAASALKDQGSTTIYDLDGTRSDLGAYGGPKGGSFDLDGDGYPNYFWPGAIADAPAGYTAANFDAADQDAAVH